MQCCMQLNNVIFLSFLRVTTIDGHFGLCRKKSAGKSVRPPLHNGVYFEDQAEVDAFVEGYNAGQAATTKVNDIDM